MYVPFNTSDPDDLAAAVKKMENCVERIAKWMQENKLKLNEDKTEFLIIIHPKLKHKVQPVNIRIGNASIPPSTSVRNLGAYFDNSMQMSDHISAISKSMNNSLRSIGKIRKYLTTKSTEL